MRAVTVTVLVGVDRDAYGCETRHGRLWKATMPSLLRALQFVFQRKVIVSNRRLANVGDDRVTA